MTETERLIELCGCKVKFEVLAACYGGQYMETGNIIINSTTSVMGQFTSLAHETGHALCDAKGCKCMSPDQKTLCEYHAYKFLLKWLLGHRCKEAVRHACDLIERVTSFNNFPHHRAAAKRVVKLKLHFTPAQLYQPLCLCHPTTSRTHSLTHSLTLDWYPRPVDHPAPNPIYHQTIGWFLCRCHSG